MTPILAAALICTSPGIVDGDTLRCDGQRVRLWGIDAPERHHPAGPASTKALARIVAGRTLTCQQKDTDRYGRIVARCFIGSLDVGGEMVRLGFAKDWKKFSGGAYSR